MSHNGLTVQVWQEGDWWVALAVEVDVATQGRSTGEAHSDLRDALQLYF